MRMAAPSTPAVPRQPLFYTIEGVCRRWEGLTEHAAVVGMEMWTLDDFFAHAFPDWQVQACLWHKGHAGAILCNPEGVLYAVPLYWPAAFLPASLGMEMSEDEENEWEEVMSYRAYGQGDREACFDAAVSGAMIAYARMDLIDLLLGDDDVPDSTDSAGVRTPHEPTQADLLTVEAIIASAEETEADSLRLLAALRGVTQPTGYTRLT